MNVMVKGRLSDISPTAGVQKEVFRLAFQALPFEAQRAVRK